MDNKHLINYKRDQKGREKEYKQVGKIEGK